jgi:hypothetical protein
MGERRQDRLARFPRALAMHYAGFLAPLLSANLLRSSQQAWDEFSVRAFLLGAVTAAVLLGLSRWFRREAVTGAQAKGMAERDVLATELFAGLGFGNFLAVNACLVTNSEGWIWGTLFYGIYLLHGAHLLLRWRRYTATPAAS